MPDQTELDQMTDMHAEQKAASNVLQEEYNQVIEDMKQMKEKWRNDKDTIRELRQRNATIDGNYASSRGAIP